MKLNIKTDAILHRDALAFGLMLANLVCVPKSQVTRIVKKYGFGIRNNNKKQFIIQNVTAGGVLIPGDLATIHVYEN